VSGTSRVALVTGGAVRIGRAIVEELAGAGWSVAFSYRSSPAAANALAAALANAGHEIAPFRANLDLAVERRRLVGEVEERFGGLDALVNNAAVFPRTPIADLDEEALAGAMRTNLEAPLFLALAAAPMLRARGGAVVNLVDVYASTPLKHYLAYSVSKAALLAATRALAVELAPEIRVNAVAPGIALFPDDYDDATRERLLRRTLLHRESGAAEIARAVRFLLADTPSTTGQLLTIA
jgi:pteridine reductase